jgi:hypothetical protein
MLPASGRRIVTRGQFAELAAIPLAQVVEVPVHLLAALGDGAFLFLQILGLLRQPGGCGIGGASGLGDFRLAALQARLVVGHRALQVGDLALPGDELLPEAGHRQPVFLAGAVQGEDLLPHAIGLFLDLAPQPLQVGVLVAGELV